MSQVQNIISVESLLAIIAFLAGGNIALIVFIAKKYIKRADDDHERLNSIYNEHLIFHKKDTGLKSG